MSADLTHPSASPGMAEHPAPEHGRFWSLPTTRLGRWAVGFGAFFFVFMAIFYGLIASDVGVGADSFLEQWPLWGSIFPAAACGIGAAVTGVWSLAAKAERSILVILVTLIGLFVVWFVAAELLFPH